MQLYVCKTGCIVGDVLRNHLTYADDLVLISPKHAGLQAFKYLHVFWCREYDVKYNASKSHIIIVEKRKINSCLFLIFISVEMFSRPHMRSDTFDTGDLSDDKDLYRQRCKPFGQANVSP